MFKGLAVTQKKIIPRELWVQVLLGEKEPISHFADLNQGRHPPHSLLQVSVLFVIHIAGMQGIRVTYEGITASQHVNAEQIKDESLLQSSSSLENPK